MVYEAMDSDNRKGVVLTCAQPTGKLHLGNYLGAIRHWVKYLDDYECLFGVVDMHAITMPYFPAELRNSSLDCVAQYVACGLDPSKSSIFLQSQIGPHAELAWILACLTPLGQLERMTQFKDKAIKQGLSVNAGLLFYPVLQAADILLYNADIVPIGEDQKQHLELTRDLAQKFNNNYSETFKIPDPIIPKEGARIMSLQNPEKKMSKSDENQMSTLYLWDEPKLIRKKISSAVTDSDNEVVAREDKQGITNLLNIMSLTSSRPVNDLEKEFRSSGYGEFKSSVADSIIAMLKPLQKRYESLKDDNAKLYEILQNGADVAQKMAYKTINKVYRKVGFIQPPR